MLRAVSQPTTVTPVVVVPTFSAFLVSPQTVAANVDTKVQMTGVDYNIGGGYNSGTFRYTPGTAGYYQVNITGRPGGTTLTAAWFTVYKNGAAYVRLVEALAGSNAGSVTMFLSATDFIELFGLVNGATTTFDAEGTVGLNGPRMSATLIRQA